MKELHCAQTTTQKDTTLGMKEIQKQSAGELLRYWRRTRRYSQMELALSCDTSSRHLSFVETGRAIPSKQLILNICRVLEVPLRACNTILLAEGYNSHYQESGLSAPEMEEARLVLDKILLLHEPYPSSLIDRCFNIVMKNEAFSWLVETFAEDYGREHSDNLNLMHMLFRSDACAPYITNLPMVYAAMMERGRRLLVAGDDNDNLAALLTEIAELRPEEHEAWRLDRMGGSGLPKLIMPVRFEKDGIKLEIFTTTAAMGAPLNITLQELQVESGYPLDEISESFFRDRSKRS